MNLDTKMKNEPKVKMIEQKIYRFSLETGSKKRKCTSCGQPAAHGYIDNVTGELLPAHVSRCDRENNCGYHYTPKQYFQDNKIEQPEFDHQLKNKEIVKPTDFLPAELIERCMSGYRESNFAKYIIGLFGEDIGLYLLRKYFVGRSKACDGTANIFPRIDAHGNVRTGKIMAYHFGTGKRNKDINPTWIHASRNENGEKLFPDFNHELCFFGEHLISIHPDQTIAICESEKTAVIASFFFPQYVWLATGGASGCKWREYSVFKVLQNRNVILFPDFGIYNKTSGKTCYQEWSERASAIMERMSCNIKVSKVLENNIPEEQRTNDYDLVDMLVKTDETGRAITDEGYPFIFDKYKDFSNHLNKH